MTIRTNAERGLLLAILLSAITLVLKIAGGILSGSLALLSDAAHVEVSPSHVSRQGEVLEAIRAALRREYRIEHVTLQPECGSECTLLTATALTHEAEVYDHDRDSVSRS